MAENKKTSIGGKSTCHLLNIKEPSRTAKRIKLSFLRTDATLTLVKSGSQVDAKVGLIDISLSGAGFFTDGLMPKGSLVEVTITDPYLLKINGVVAWSVPVSSGLIKQKFNFRTGVQFQFDNEVKKTALIEFIQKVQSDPTQNLQPRTASDPSQSIASKEMNGPLDAEGLPVSILTPNAEAVTAEAVPSAEATEPAQAEASTASEATDAAKSEEEKKAA
ncbi:MAG: PilZ domain-containing protein [Oligoflexia bacterium]|nr:PilZ domain-containing protein [Oligoflexia bacterium]